MTTVTVSSKYQIVIPKSARGRLKIKPGQELVVLEKDDSFELVKVGPIEEAAGFLPGLMKGTSWKDLRDHSERFD